MKAPSEDDKRLVLFENRWLEKLTIVSVGWFAVVWAVLLPTIAFTAWGTTPLLSAAGLVFSGLLVWCLFEYVAHRHLFHWQSQNLFIRKIVFLIHGNHHAQPGDAMRNLMPPIVSVSVGMALWGILYAVAGNAGTLIILGFISGYVAYDLTHYACHQWPMRGSFGRMMKRHHMRHHFVSSKGNFAITAIFLDGVFRTRVFDKGEGEAERTSDLVHSSK